MKILKNKKILKKCACSVILVGALSGIGFSVDAISVERKMNKVKDDVYEENKDAYVEFLGYEIDKLQTNYTNGEITFDDYMSTINNYSNPDRYKKEIIEKYISDEDKTKLDNLEKRGYVEIAGFTASIAAMSGAYFSLFKLSDDEMII